MSGSIRSNDLVYMRRNNKMSTLLSNKVSVFEYLKARLLSSVEIIDISVNISTHWYIINLVVQGVLGISVGITTAVFKSLIFTDIYCIS